MPVLSCSFLPAYGSHCESHFEKANSQIFSMTDKPPVVIVCVGMAGKSTFKVDLGEKPANNLNPHRLRQDNFHAKN